MSPYGLYMAQKRGSIHGVFPELAAGPGVLDAMATAWRDMRHTRIRSQRDALLAQADTAASPAQASRLRVQANQLRAKLPLPPRHGPAAPARADSRHHPAFDPPPIPESPGSYEELAAMRDRARQLAQGQTPAKR